MKVHPDKEGRILNYAWCSVMYVGIFKNVSSRVKLYFGIYWFLLATEMQSKSIEIVGRRSFILV